MNEAKTERPALPTRVARFAHDSGRFNASGPTWKCFEPSKKDNSTSVFSIDDLSSEEVWELGDEQVVIKGKCPVARAEIESADVGVQVDQHKIWLKMDNEPPRHGALLGWPPWELKDQIRLLALELAKKATLVRRP